MTFVQCIGFNWFPQTQLYYYPDGLELATLRFDFELNPL